MPSRRSSLFALTLSALLAACAAPSGSQPPTSFTPTPAPPTAVVYPTARPTTAPTAVPTAAATTAPTTPSPAPSPAAGAALPQPLYLLQAGQIFRLEADGATRTQITYEVPFRPDVVAVTEFAVSPADGSLAYVVQRQGTSVLVRSGPGGEEPAPIFDSPAASPSFPLFTPDGEFVAARLVAAEGEEQFQSGLYLVPVAGGEPQLVAADEDGAFGQQPLAFSPDGIRLLTNRFSLAVEQCDLAVVAVDGGATTPLQVPPPADGERATTCDSGVWAPDGSAVYFAPLTVGAVPGSPAIWRASPATGESFPLTPQPDAPPFTLYASPGVAPDGSLLAFTAAADALPRGFDEGQAPLAYTMARVDPADGLAAELRPAVEETPQLVQWDREGRGAVALLAPAVGDPGLFWLPADGGEAALLLGATTDLSAYRWAAGRQP